MLRSRGADCGVAVDWGILPTLRASRRIDRPLGIAHIIVMSLFTPRTWIMAVFFGALALRPSIASEPRRISDVQYFKQHKSFVEKGDNLSIYTVGLCYSEGIGVAKDPVEAYAYWSLREMRDQEDARWALYLLGKEISPETRLRGEQRIGVLQAELDAKVAAHKAGKQFVR